MPRCRQRRSVMGQQFRLAFDEIGTSQRRKTEVRLTHRWREEDSNHRSRLKYRPFGRPASVSERFGWRLAHSSKPALCPVARLTRIRISPIVFRTFGLPHRARRCRNSVALAGWTDGSNPLSSSGESCKLHFASPALVTSDSGRAGGPKRAICWHLFTAGSPRASTHPILRRRIRPA